MRPRTQAWGMARGMDVWAVDERGGRLGRGRVTYSRPDADTGDNLNAGLEWDDDRLATATKMVQQVCCSARGLVLW